MEISLLNSGAALYLADKASNIREGIELARKIIDSGAALAKLEAFKQCSNRLHTEVS